MRLLGDRVLRRVAWRIADELRWPDAFVAESVALIQLQADAFVCTDAELSRAVSGTVTVVSIDDVIGRSA